MLRPTSTVSRRVTTKGRRFPADPPRVEEIIALACRAIDGQRLGSRPVRPLGGISARRARVSRLAPNVARFVSRTGGLVALVACLNRSGCFSWVANPVRCGLIIVVQRLSRINIGLQMVPR